MGDAADLKRLKVAVRRPGLYGDLVTYGAKVTDKNDADGTVTLEITGTKRHDGQVGTTGEAVVALPRRGA